MSGSQVMVEKNAIDCRPISSAIDQAIGLRQSGSPIGAGTGSCARSASGSQTAAATTPTSAQIGQRALPPAERIVERDRDERGDRRAGHEGHQNAPVSTPVPSRRLRAHPRGRDDLGQRDRRARQQRPEVQRRDPAEPAHGGADGGHEAGDQQHRSTG